MIGQRTISSMKTLQICCVREHSFSSFAGAKRALWSYYPWFPSAHLIIVETLSKVVLVSTTLRIASMGLLIFTYIYHMYQKKTTKCRYKYSLKTNMCPENGWLQDVFSLLKMVLFSGYTSVHFRGLIPVPWMVWARQQVFFQRLLLARVQVPHAAHIPGITIRCVTGAWGVWSLGWFSGVIKMGTFFGGD